jgi:hypothetical protein
VRTVAYTATLSTSNASVAVQCIAVLAFAVVVHHISMDARSLAIIAWGLIAVPAAIIPVLRGGLHTIVGITVWLVTGWQALAYCGDMGGPYAHYLAAGPVCLATLVTTAVLFVIVCVRILRPTRSRYVANLPKTIGTFDGEIDGGSDSSAPR